MKVEVVEFAQYKAKRAAEFYEKHVSVFSDKNEVERIKYLGGSIDMGIVRAATRIKTPSGYIYSPDRFRFFCAKYFSTNNADMKSYLKTNTK